MVTAHYHVNPRVPMFTAYSSCWSR